MIQEPIYVTITGARGSGKTIAGIVIKHLLERVGYLVDLEETHIGSQLTRMIEHELERLNNDPTRLAQLLSEVRTVELTVVNQS